MVIDLFANRFTDRSTTRTRSWPRTSATTPPCGPRPADRLLEWKPGDGWEPICERLGLDVPDEPFPVTNTTEEFRAMLGSSRGER